MHINLLGIDIAKNVFQLHGIDNSGKKVLKQRIERTKLSFTPLVKGRLSFDELKPTSEEHP